MDGLRRERVEAWGVLGRVSRWRRFGLLGLWLVVFEPGGRYDWARGRGDANFESMRKYGCWLSSVDSGSPDYSGPLPNPAAKSYSADLYCHAIPSLPLVPDLLDAPFACFSHGFPGG